MNTKVKAVDSDDAWEDRRVGADEAFAEVAPDISAALDAALDLHPISIRLQKALVDNLKALAHLHGLGYQPMIRQVLTRWVDSELKQMVIQHANAKAVAMAKSAAERVKAEPGTELAARHVKHRKVA